MRRFIPLALIVAMPAGLAAQTVPDEAPPADMAAQVAAATAAAEAGGAGPFKAEMRSPAGLPTHTVYQPRNLAAATHKGKLPIVAWGNGACANYGNRFRYFLTEVASHGYLVVAIGPRGPQVVEWKTDITPADAPKPADRPPNSYAANLAMRLTGRLPKTGARAAPILASLIRLKWR